MKSIITLISTALLLSTLAVQAESNTTFKAYTLQDQHGEAHTLAPETRTVIMAFEMYLSKSIHTWLSDKDADYLAKHQAEYVVDISPMPRIITVLFAGPKMKKYDFPIIQAKDDDFASNYPVMKDKITVLQLDAKQENAKVLFVNSPADIENILDPEGTAARTAATAEADSAAALEK